MAQAEATNFLNFLGTDPGFEDLINRATAGTDFSERSLSSILSGSGATLANLLGGRGGAIAGTLGLGRLNEILLRGGRSDPALFNRQIAQAERGTQARQRAVEGDFARRNLGGAGALPALQAAIGQSGEARVAEIGERETQLAQERLSRALDQLGTLVQDPAIDLTAIGEGVFSGSRQRATQQQGAILQFLGSLLGAGLS